MHILAHAYGHDQCIEAGHEAGHMGISRNVHDMGLQLPLHLSHSGRQPGYI